MKLRNGWLPPIATVAKVRSLPAAEKVKTRVVAPESALMPPENVVSAELLTVTVRSPVTVW
ncbi:MAG: hypothetical protein M3275_14805, partial [Thermoproteota archaeon]|nr:hypothetical protein [Thermoproteota archaeon]